MTEQPMRILIADDHPVFRRGLRASLDSVPDMEVVGEATTGNDAAAAASSLEPHVVVMDVQMPTGNGVAATTEILRRMPGVGVLILTMYDDDELVFAAMRAGARGYLLKYVDAAEIVRAIRVVSDGGAIFSSAIARRLNGYFSAITPSAATLAFPQLTEREREVLALIAAGLGNKEIAHQLSLSPKTIRNRVSCIFNKLQVADRAQAIVRAREAGLAVSQPVPSSSRAERTRIT